MKSHKMTPLGQFIADELTRRNMSQNELARLIGVNSSTLTKAMRLEGAPEPTLTFLNKLAKATETDISALVKMAVGESDMRAAKAMLIAKRIEALPPEAQEMIDRMLLGLGAVGHKTGGQTND